MESGVLEERKRAGGRRDRVPKAKAQAKARVHIRWTTPEELSTLLNTYKADHKPAKGKNARCPGPASHCYGVSREMDENPVTFPHALREPIPALCRHDFAALFAGLLYFVLAASWISDMASFPADSAVPVEITRTETYKTFFRDVVEHVRNDEGQTIERKTAFYHNPLVNLRTVLRARGKEGGFDVNTEKVLAAQVNWRSFILYTGIWFLTLGGFYWFMGEGPFRLRSLKLPNDPRHPSWIVLKIGLAGAVLTAILAFSASNFDSTEVVSIGTFLLAALGIDGIHLSRLRKQHDLAEDEARQDKVRRMRAV